MLFRSHDERTQNRSWRGARRRRGVSLLHRDQAGGDFWIALDLIGYSEDEYGERLCADRVPSLGYKEHHLLGWALLAYAHRPGDVLERVAELIADELEGN